MPLIYVNCPEGTFSATAKNELAEKLTTSALRIENLPETSFVRSTAEKLAQAHQQADSYYLASPVLGRPDIAQAGKLNICLLGNSTAKERVQPLLEVLGQKVYDFGDTPSSANVIKLSANFTIAAVIEAMAAAFTLAEKNCIPRT